MTEHPMPPSPLADRVSISVFKTRADVVNIAQV
jgi:hypothetical protein